MLAPRELYLSTASAADPRLSKTSKRSGRAILLEFRGAIIVPYLQAPGIRKCFKMTRHMKISLAFLQLVPEAATEAPLLEWAQLLVAPILHNFNTSRTHANHPSLAKNPWEQNTMQGWQFLQAGRTPTLSLKPLHMRAKPLNATGKSY